jgi:glyoxylase-like metal-dependent hydrolase (beta-lactamase superfamily II)
MEVIATPGHTPGSICLLDRETGVLVVGDAFNRDGTAVSGPRPEFTADLAQAESSLRKLAELPFETVLFGHAEPLEGSAGDALDAYVASLSPPDS